MPAAGKWKPGRAFLFSYLRMRIRALHFIDFYIRIGEQAQGAPCAAIWHVRYNFRGVIKVAVKPANEEKILTEVGTNEWQVVVFLLGNQYFAINVDKTREILRWPGARDVPQTHDAMRGITTIRGEVIPLIDLRTYLAITPGVELENSKLIVAEFNRMKLGFVVDAVDRIYRINSDELDASLTGTFLGENSLYVIKREGRNILLLDYERIVQVVNPSLAEEFKLDGKDYAVDVKSKLGDPDEFKILVAEDSPLIRKLVQGALAAGGFHNLEMVGHGKAAWDRLVEDGDEFDILLTDIEMPKLDGLTLTRRVKEDKALEHIPIIVFSSVMAEDIKRKAVSIGADAQITKPEISRLLDTVIELLERSQKNKKRKAS